jgi:hypothetical protein
VTINKAYLVDAVGHALVQVVDAALLVGLGILLVAVLLGGPLDHVRQLGAVLEVVVQDALRDLAVSPGAARLLLKRYIFR